MDILAIDPGPVESAWVLWDGERVHLQEKMDNLEMVKETRVCPYWPVSPDLLAVEQIKSYGMSVSDSVFDTVFWSGRFCEAFEQIGGEFVRIPRMDVKMHLCHSSRAKDGNIIQALVDRFAPYEKNRGKGTKREPGFFHGFAGDVWQAMAVAVTVYDQNLYTNE